MVAKVKKTQENKEGVVKAKTKKTKKVSKSPETKVEKPVPVIEPKVGKFRKTFESIKKWFREIHKEAELKKE